MIHKLHRFEHFSHTASHPSDTNIYIFQRWEDHWTRAHWFIHFSRKESVLFWNVFLLFWLFPHNPKNQALVLIFFFSDLFIISLTLENWKGKVDLGPSFKFTYATQPPRFVLFLYNMYILPVYLQSELLIKAWNVRVMQLSFLTKTYMKDIVIHNGQSGVL